MAVRGTAAGAERGTGTRAAGVLAGAVALVMLAAGAGAGAAGETDDRSPAGRGVRHGVRSEGVFSPPNAFLASAAVTYDTALVPAAARITVDQYPDASGTTVTARLRGLVPDRAYGMRLHPAPCGAGDESGAGASVDGVRGDGVRTEDLRTEDLRTEDLRTEDLRTEAFRTGDAGPARLDFRTDAVGDGAALGRQARGSGLPDGGVVSVVLYAAQDGTGARIGCFGFPLAPVG